MIDSVQRRATGPSALMDRGELSHLSLKIPDIEIRPGEARHIGLNAGEFVALEAERAPPKNRVA